MKLTKPMDYKPTIIGIAGPTGSGKSTFAKRLHEELGRESFLYALDRDYKSLDHVHPKERTKVNYDHPDSLDLHVSRRCIHSMKNGRKEVFLNTYNYAQHTRGIRQRLIIGDYAGKSAKTGPVLYYPKLSYVVVEGLFALHPMIRDLIDIGVYLDVDLEECFNRRLARDTVERGRTARSVNVQWNRTVITGYKEAVAPTRDHAHFVSDGAPSSLDETFRMILEKLHQ